MSFCIFKWANFLRSLLYVYIFNAVLYVLCHSTRYHVFYSEMLTQEKFLATKEHSTMFAMSFS